MMIVLSTAELIMIVLTMKILVMLVQVVVVMCNSECSAIEVFDNSLKL